MAGPLDGERILDLTTVGYGPYACQILGDYGAEIIKVESKEGDITRGIAPFRNAGMGPFFLMANRNKRCIVLDLKTDDGRKACLKLVEKSAALVTSIRPAAMERLGLGYEDCRTANPDIVYGALVGFGQSGPYAKRPAYDDIIQGVSGMADMQGGREGPPQFINAAVCDKICSQVAVHAIIAALFRRLKTGKGQLVEVPMYESMVGFNLVEHQAGETFEPPLGPVGYERSMVEYRRPFATTDGYVCVLPYNTKQWQSFLVAMGREDLRNDVRVTDPKTRSEKIGELYELVAALVRDWKTDDLLAALEKADVPYGKATPMGELADDLHLQAVGLFRSYNHPTEGMIRLTEPPVKFSKTPAEIHSLPVALGENSVEILREAGYSDPEISELMGKGVSVDGRLSQHPPRSSATS